MTVTLDEAIAADRSRTALVTALAEVRAWLRANPGSPIPVVTVTFPLSAEPGRQADELEDIAWWLGVTVTDDGTGTLTAARDFGPVRAEAHLAPGNAA